MDADQDRIAALSEAAELVLADVVPEFAKVSTARVPFERWKRELPDTYVNAYCSMSLPEIFGPYVTLQMVLWDPLASDKKGGVDSASSGGDFLERFEWYNSLMEETPESSQELHQNVDGTPIAPPPDPDENLVPKLIQSSVLPLVLRAIREQWDPYSKQQSSALWGVVDELIVFQVG